MGTIKVLCTVWLLFVVAVILSLTQCRGTSQIIPSGDEAAARQTELDEYRNYRDSMNQMSRHELWASANSGVDEGMTSGDLEYYEDKRVDLCFVVFKNRDIEKVPCGHLNSVNKFILGER
ncbi:hypothetical protein KAR91_71965 [Candidatus Pacearchaeota archaeon]|nr:hypothetical protein [Candidatus Pacearchaeota archaeon]